MKLTLLYSRLETIQIFAVAKSFQIELWFLFTFLSELPNNKYYGWKVIILLVIHVITGNHLSHFFQFAKCSCSPNLFAFTQN